MADKPNKLTQAQKDAAVAFINERWAGDKACPVCLTAKWSLSDHTVTPLNVTGNVIHGSGVTYPMVMAVCTNCGNTRFFNAVLMGILDMSWQEEAEKEKPAEAEPERKKPEEEKSDG